MIGLISNNEDDKIITTDNSVPISVAIEPIFIIGPHVFEEKIKEKALEYIKKGRVVLTQIEMPSVMDEETAMNVKTVMEDYVRIAHTVYVMNIDGFIDASSQKLIEFAKNLNKNIEYYCDKTAPDVHQYLCDVERSSIEELNKKYDILSTVLLALEACCDGMTVMTEEEINDITLYQKDVPYPKLQIRRIEYNPELVLYIKNSSMCIHIRRSTEGHYILDAVCSKRLVSKYDLSNCNSIQLDLTDKTNISESYNFDDDDFNCKELLFPFIKDTFDIRRG